MLPLCDAAGLHDPPDTCTCIIHLLHDMNMSGLFVVPVLYYYYLHWRIHSGVPCCFPPLRKEGERPVTPLHYYLPFHYRDLALRCGATSWGVRRRVVRGREAGAQALHRHPRLSISAAPTSDLRTPIGYLYSPVCYNQNCDF